MTTRPVPMVENRPGRITKDLLQFMRNAQAWYQGEGCHLAASPGDHTVEATLTRLASQCLCLESFQVPHIAEPHRFSSPSDRGTLHLVATKTGEYLALLVRNQHGQIAATGITHLVRDGKSFIRVVRAGEHVCAVIDLQAMNSHIVSVDLLVETIKRATPHAIDERTHDQATCFVDLRKDATLQTYATVRHWTELQEQPIIVNGLFDAVYRQVTCRTPSVSFTLPTPFEADVCQFLLAEYWVSTGGTVLVPSMDFDASAPSTTPREGIVRPTLLFIICSSRALTQQMGKAIRHSFDEIARRTGRMPR